MVRYEVRECTGQHQSPMLYHIVMVHDDGGDSFISGHLDRKAAQDIVDFLNEQGERELKRRLFDDS